MKTILLFAIALSGCIAKEQLTVEPPDSCEPRANVATACRTVDKVLRCVDPDDGTTWDLLSNNTEVHSTADGQAICYRQYIEGAMQVVWQRELAGQ